MIALVHGIDLAVELGERLDFVRREGGGVDDGELGVERHDVGGASCLDQVEAKVDLLDLLQLFVGQSVVENRGHGILFR